jgi:signal peptidase I
MASTGTSLAGQRRLGLLRVPPLLRQGGAAALILFALVGLWWTAAPPALGGRTTIVTVDGTSMLPDYKRSDLVALRPATKYHVGDVVGYRSTMLHRIVMHRIVAVHQGHYILKGDNNTFTDPEQPTDARVVGRATLHLPAAGSAIQWLRKPWLLALLAAAAVLVLGLDIRREPAEDTPTKEATR